MRRSNKRIILAFHWYLESLHEGAQRRAMEAGYETDVLDLESVERLALEDFAGVVGMLPPSLEHPVARVALASGKPVAELSLAHPENKHWGRCPEDCDAIARLAAAHLAGLPVASFLYISGGNWWNHNARFEAFRQALAKDRRPCVRFDLTPRNDAQLSDLAGTLAALPRPVAVFGSVDEYARAALDAAMETGLRVPADVRILGFGNREIVSRVAPVPLSTIEIDYRAWAAAAVDLLIDMIEGRAPPGESRPFAPGAVLVRESTGVAPADDGLHAAALALMRKNPANPLSLPRLAESLGVSNSTLKRAFSAAGESGVARRYLELRIDTAKARLAAGDKTEAAAAAAGFDSYRGFVKAFTKIAGTTPGAYARGLGKASNHG